MKKEMLIPALAAALITIGILSFGVFRPKTQDPEPAAAKPAAGTTAEDDNTTPLPTEQEAYEPTPSPIPEEPAAREEPDDPMFGLSEEDYGELLRILDEIGEQEAPFALMQYVQWKTDETLALMDRIGLYADTNGLSYEQMRGILYARNSLDTTAAKGYALLLKKCYEVATMDFLRAWHETGEPTALMYEVTGVAAPESCYNWLHEKWEIWCNTPDSDPEP